MSRVNHTDTLVTELRELRRRLRLLEAALSASTAATPLVPSRPVDWPASTSSNWEELFGATTPGGLVRLRFVVDNGSSGSVLVTVDGQQVGPELVAATAPTSADVPVTAGLLSIQARVTAGSGAVRVSAAR